MHEAGRRSSTLRWAGGGFLVVCLLLVPGLVTHGPALHLRLGDESFSLELARELFGEDVPALLRDKHDGEWFWNVARDPLLLDVDALRERLDRPVYRSQRILYPVIAAPGRLVSEHTLLWTLIAVNVAVLAFGSRLAAGYVDRLRLPPRAVLAYIASPVIFLTPFLNVSDALAVTALLGAALAARQRRVGLVALASVLAALAKESMLGGLVGLAVLAPGLDRRTRLAAIVPGAAAAGLWGLYVRFRFGTEVTEVQEFVLLPFSGFVTAWNESWSPAGVVYPLVASIALILVAAVAVALWARRRSLEMAVALPFAVMVPFFTRQVLDVPINSYRAIGPLLTLVVWELYRQFVAEADHGRGESRSIESTRHAVRT